MPDTTEKYRPHKWDNGIQGTGHEATKGRDPWKMEINGEPCEHSSFLPGVDLQAMAEGEAQKGGLPEWNRKELGSWGGLSNWRSTGRVPERRLHTEAAGWLCGESPSKLQSTVSKGGSYPRPRRETIQRIGINHHQGSHGREHSLFPPTEMKTPYSSEGR